MKKKITLAGYLQPFGSASFLKKDLNKINPIIETGYIELVIGLAAK